MNPAINSQSKRERESNHSTVAQIQQHSEQWELMEITQNKLLTHDCNRNWKGGQRDKQTKAESV